MKICYNFFLCLIFIFFSEGSFGQSNSNDPTFSTRNYKHPNKANAQKEVELSKVAQIEFLKSRGSEHGNYKMQKTSISRPAAIPIAENPKRYGGKSNNNYKQQFKPR